MVSQPPPTEVGLVFESLEASSRVAQLEAEIAQLKDALAPAAADRSGDRAGGPALRPSPRAGLVTAGTRLPKRPCQGSNIAQTIINARCGRQPSRGRNTQRDRDA